MNELLNEILDSCRHHTNEGNLANYIPQLAKVDRNRFGICVVTPDGVFRAGDWQAPFTMQSIVKPLILLLALMDKGEAYVRNLVGVEATGKPFDAFNYSDQAMKSEHINPMINTGAIALCTAIEGYTYEEKFLRLLDLAKKLSGNPHLRVDEEVYYSEKATGNKNRALAYMLKAYGLVHDRVEDVLDVYFRACSIQVTTEDLAKIGLVLASKGKNIFTDELLVSSDYTRYVNAVLTTCGMYDGSGEFALNVGVPAKSGVGGGIMAVVPSRMGIGIYSPALDEKGNSVAGIKALEQLSKRLDLTIF